jgi:Ran GTPase-activating protein (RanGAP) involved in mRNA processing and transport
MAEDEIDSSGTELNLSGRHLWGAVTNRLLHEHLSSRIVTLDLSTNHLTPDSATFLAQLLTQPSSTIRYLSVIETRLINRASATLFEAVGRSQLLELLADDNIFNEESCKVLADTLSSDPPLELLSLCGCDIPSEGGAAIARALPQNHHLRHLRLESNSLYDPGAQALGDVMGQSSLTSISLADNEIWGEGIRAFLGGCREAAGLKSLDVSYNIVSVPELAALMRQGTLQALSVSGAKVSETEVSAFLEAIGSSALQVLIIDGFNFSVLPISWPKVDDRLWQTASPWLDLLLKNVGECESLEDLRVGYLDLDALTKVRDAFSGRHLTLSIHDFGRTNNCWVITFPGFTLAGPTATFEWRKRDDRDKDREKIRAEHCALVGEIIRGAIFEGGPITAINLSQTDSGDDVFGGILRSIGGMKLELLDFSDNPLTDGSLADLEVFLRDNGGEVRDLKLSKTRMTDIGIARFFRALPDLHRRSVRKVWLSFDHQIPFDELAGHECFMSIGDALRSGYPLEEVHFSGPITAGDAGSVVKALSVNSHLKVLDFESDFTERYASPDPSIPAEVQRKFDTLVEDFHHVLREKKTQCRLHTFKFPLLTEVFIYSDPILEKWPECEEKLESNRKGKSATNRGRK